MTTDLSDRLFKYFERIGIALSVLLNVILGGRSNQTFSARNYGWKKAGYPNLVWLIDFVFFFEANHCLTSWSYWYIRHNLEELKNSVDISPKRIYNDIHVERIYNETTFED